MSTLMGPEVTGTRDPSTAETIAELLHCLGDISASRVRLHPYPGTATAKDVLEIEAREGRLFELVDGVLVEKPMGAWESFVASLIITELNIWVRPRNLGRVFGPDVMLRILPKAVRMPDVSFISLGRFPGGVPSPEPVPEISPDLAVEVVSDGNTKKEIDDKRREYFNSGTQLVWVVEPRKRMVLVYESAKAFQAYGIDAVLNGGRVLPGFTLPVRAIFEGIPDKY